MPDRKKTRDQLLKEIKSLKDRLAELGRELSTLESSRENMELYQAHLEEITDIRETELMEALKAAERANVAKDAFLANLSHEIHTPIHQINSYAHLGIQKLNRAIETQVAVPEIKLLHYFENIHAASNNLHTFVTSLLNLMKIETGDIQYHFRKCSIEETIRAQYQEAAEAFPDKKTSIEILEHDIDTSVDIDLRWIGEVLKNLFSNAIKFSPPGGRITVSFEQSHLDIFEKSHAGLQVNIRDQGIGIPDQDLDLIFEKFTQSSLTADGSGGKGIGLAICRGIIADHNGKIFAESNPDGGATFSMILLVDQPQDPCKTKTMAGFDSAR